MTISIFTHIVIQKYKNFIIIVFTLEPLEFAPSNF